MLETVASPYQSSPPQHTNFVACCHFVQALERDPGYVPDEVPDFGQEELNEIRDHLLDEIREGVKARAILQLINDYKQKVPAFATYFKAPTNGGGLALSAQ